MDTKSTKPAKHIENLKKNEIILSQSLKAAEHIAARYQAILEAVPDILMEVDNKKVYTWANRAGINFFGNDVIGKNAADYFEGKQDILTQVQPVFNGDPGVVYVESWQRRKDGEKRLLAWWCKTLKDTKGSVIGALSSARDITERRKSTHELIVKEELYRSIYDTAANLIMSLDSDGIIVDCNERITEILGYTKKKIVGQHMEKIIHPAYLVKAQETLKEILSVGYSHGQECKMMRKDGSVIDVSINSSGLKGGNGRYYRTICIVEDVTERKQAEQKISQLAKFPAENPNPVLRVSQNGKILYANKSSDAVLKAWKAAVGQTVPDLWQTIIQAVIDTGTIKKLDIDAGPEAFSLTFTPVHGESYVNIYGMPATELKAYQKTLIENEQRFRSIFDHSAVGIVFVNVHGKFMMVNKHFCDLLGYSEHELLKLTFFDITYPEDLKKDEDFYRDFLNGTFRETYLEKRYLHKNGMPIWCSVAISLKKDLQGKPDYFITMIRNITLRKNTEKALQESEEKYRDLYETMAQGAVYQDANGKIISANPAAQTILGLSLDQMQGRHSIDSRWKAIHEDGSDFPGNTHPAMEALASGKAVHNVIMGVYNTKENGYLWIKVSAVPKFIKGQTRPYQVFTTFEDITEQKKITGQIQESEKMYRTLFDGSAAGILIADIETKMFRHANRKICEYLGYSREELQRMSVEDIHPPDKLQYVLAEFNAQAAGERNFAKDIPCLRKDGGIVYAEINTAKVFMDGREYNIGFFRDITQEKKVREEMENIEKQFLQAQKMESIGRLAGGIAHDFNNLLTVIMGNSQLLLSEIPAQTQAHEDARNIMETAKQASALTKQLLSFTRRPVINPVCLDTKKTLRNFRDMLAHIIGEDITVSLEIEPDTHNLLIGPGQLEQILMNLVINAREAMAHGGKLVLKTKSIAIAENENIVKLNLKPGVFVCLMVEDTGSGIAEESLPYIFDPFYTTKQLGNGLGLSVVYNLVQQNNGWVTVSSEVNKGSIFEVYLPACFEKPDPIESREIKQERAVNAGESILVVEDKETVRAVVRRILLKHGYRVFEADSVATALDIFNKEKDNISLLFTDVVLPDKSGMELVELVTKEKPGLKIVMGSGYTSGKIKWDIFEKKGYKFLQKPYDLQEVSRTIQELLAK